MTVPDPDALLAAAHDAARRGWRILPLHTPTETGCSCGRSGCNSVGKHPVEARWQATPAMSGADVQATFEDGIYNLGIATGAASGFWVLDIDTDKPGVAERARELTTAHGKLPATRIIKTGGGGFQYYWAMPDFEVTNSAKRLPDGIDVRGTGGQVVAPPSVSGKGPYSLFIDAPIVRAPEWLEELVRPLPPAAPVDLESLPKITDLSAAEQRRLSAYTDNVWGRELDRLKQCREQGWGGPGWNDTTYQVACTMIELANSPWCPMTLERAHAYLVEWAPRDANFGDAEIEGCFTSALKTVDGKGRDLPPNRTPDITVIPGDPLTDPTAGATPTPGGGAAPDSTIVRRVQSDIGNARRLVDVAGHRLRYIPEAKEWAVYSDGVWALESGSGMAAVQDMIEDLVDREGHLYSDDPGGDDGTEPSERDRFFKWAMSQQQAARVSAAVLLATARPELKASLIDFDQDPELMNVANGIVNLRTGELAAHSPDVLSMLQSPVPYDRTATAPVWDAFLERCLPDAEIRDYLQMVFGYSLTGSMAEQAMFLHHGSGANGKSVFLIVAAHIAGSYSQVVPRETLLAKGATTEHPTSVARMRGRRFLQASETAAGRRLDEETVKGLTGGEAQTARFMGANFFDFTPTGKIHFVTNHLPRLTDAESIWRRLHLIAWTQTIPVPERDPQLAAKIIANEAPGVLAWAVEGAKRWHELNAAGSLLTLPDSMKRDLAEYRSDQDVLGEFIASRLQADTAAFTANSEIYGAYQNWCFNSGIKNPMTAQDLNRALTERRFAPHRTAKSRGFRLNLLAVGHDVDADQRDPLVTA